MCSPNPDPDENFLYVNDLERAAFAVLPELKEFKENLRNLGFSNVVMTGSGTAFLCFGDVQKPYLPDTTFYSVTTIQRDHGNWYGDVNL